MLLDYTDTFVTAEYIRRGVRKAEKSIREDFNHPAVEAKRVEAQEALKSMKRSLASVVGMQSLDLDQAFRDARRRVPFWKRRAFDLGESEWKAEEKKRREAEAAAVDTFEL